MTDLRFVTEGAISIAKNYIMDGHEHQAMAIVFVPNSENAYLVPVITNNEENKEASTIMLRQAVAEHGADAVVFITEGWGLKMDKDADMEKVMASRPSASPDRIEVLVVEGKNATGDSLCYIAQIHRKDDGISFEPMGEMDDPAMKAKSRFTDNLWGIVQ